MGQLACEATRERRVLTPRFAVKVNEDLPHARVFDDLEGLLSVRQGFSFLVGAEREIRAR